MNIRCDPLERGLNSLPENEWLRLASREQLRGGVRQRGFRRRGGAEPSRLPCPQPLAPRRGARRSIEFRYAPAILALAQGEPPEACRKLAEEALPEHLRAPEPPEAVEAPPSGCRMPEAEAPQRRQAAADVDGLDQAERSTPAMLELPEAHKKARRTARPQIASRNAQRKALSRCAQGQEARSGDRRYEQGAHLKAPSLP